MDMETSSLSKYEQKFMDLNSKKERFDFLIILFEEYKNQSSTALDPGAVFSQEDEEEFGELGDFISEKLESLREELFD